MKINYRCLILLFSAYVFFKGNASAQSLIMKRHQLGIDITNTLTFLKQNNQSYLVNYRYNIKGGKYALRTSLNLDLSKGESEGFYTDLKIGWQRNHLEKNWLSYFGVDASFSYYKSNASPITSMVFGLTPFLGAEYYFNHRISASTEAGLNFQYFYSHNDFTYDAQKSSQYTRVYIGYIGMIIVHYHF
jgi:hypothetical protein